MMSFDGPPTAIDSKEKVSDPDWVGLRLRDRSTIIYDLAWCVLMFLDTPTYRVETNTSIVLNRCRSRLKNRISMKWRE